ncbi:hypothetical protein LV89_01913 [Arcicella aurantiaca]|uniref:Lipocalin-like protein n=1 Tax=Arcicella aurantiaca TaxID=591202 RepID=A0A316EEK2_9BACT|nr:hypothetical protein [Arcicella aurantiaca]PWK27099.1 hypothetical protein LV89_01913 [Arcicella aurantiaca]
MKLSNLIIVFIFITSLACSTKIDDPTPSSSQPIYITALLGRWEVKSATVWKNRKVGGVIPLGRFREGLAYIFYSNGTYDGCIQAGSDWDNAGQTGTLGQWNCSTNKAGKWKIEVGGKNGNFLTTGSFIVMDAPDNVKLIYQFLEQTDKTLLLEEARQLNSDGDEVFTSLELMKK